MGVIASGVAVFTYLAPVALACCLVLGHPRSRSSRTRPWGSLDAAQSPKFAGGGWILCLAGLAAAGTPVALSYPLVSKLGDRPWAGGFLSGNSLLSTAVLSGLSLLCLVWIEPTCQGRQGKSLRHLFRLWEQALLLVRLSGFIIRRESCLVFSV
ncbi:MAG UNVERIFIED_CONTAM: hypothetical protein LVR29_30010 [Microcystis novacekii LVE1205-3]